MKQEWIGAVYDTLCGNRIDPIFGVENAFKEGEVCERCYSNVMEAYQRICTRLGQGEEDEDVEIIIDSLLKIAKVLSYKMYEYGSEFEGFGK